MKSPKAPEGVELPLLDEEFWQREMKKERALFAEAKAGSKEAALELLLLHSHAVRMAAPEVQEALEEGVRDALLGPFLEARTERNRNMPQLNVLELLGEGEAVRTREGEKIKDEINPHTTRAIALRRSFGSLESTLFWRENGIDKCESIALDRLGLLLTPEDARKAFATDFNKKTKSRSRNKKELDPEFWPDTLQDAERFLISYVLHRWKKADPAEAKLYVRESFSQVDWSQLDAPDCPEDLPVPWEAFGLPR